MSLIETTADRLSAAKLFAAFNAVLLLGVGGILIFLNLTNDLYAPLPLNALTLGSLLITWLAASAAFVFEVLCLHKQNKIQNINAVIVFLSMIEIGALGYVTEQRLTTPFLNHEKVEYQDTIHFIENANAYPDAYREKDLSLAIMTMRSGALLISYKIQPGSGFYVSDSVRSHLKEKACGYFKTYSRYKTLQTTVYSFLSEGKTIFSYVVSVKDCATTETNIPDTSISVTTSSVAPQPAVVPPIVAVTMPPPASANAEAIAIKSINKDQPNPSPQATPSPAFVNQIIKLEKSVADLQRAIEAFNQRILDVENRIMLQGKSSPPSPQAH